jgi:hypothetical protein
MRSASPSPWNLLWILAACAPSPSTSLVDAGADRTSQTCTWLLGSPNAHTGLDLTACRPVCNCGAKNFTPRVWTPSSLAVLRSFTQLDPPALLSGDPYAAPPPLPVPSERVCAARFVSERNYQMLTFASASEARAAGAVPSHGGSCGVCSSLVDLAVYAAMPDLTAPVRQCGVRHFGDFEGLVGCLAELGFTRPCAQVWAYNTEHTRAACGAICLSLLNAPYHSPDGTLNACLACDEAESGAVFKAVAGRTRRNSGLANAMCRPCTEVLRFSHDYPGVGL